MHNWLGAGLVALGIGLLVSGVMKRQAKLRAAEAAPGAIPDIRPEFAAMGEIMRPIILFALGFVGLKMTLFYAVLGGQHYMSPLDFGGFLFVLVAYGIWLVLATKRPAPRPARQAETGAQPAAAAGE
jgi:hypothetical protein